jgi:hypothetical protein
VLVELPHQRVDRAGVKSGPGELVERGDDPDVRDVRRVLAAEGRGQVLDVPGADVPGPARSRHHERDVFLRDLRGEQADLGVAEQQRRRRAEGGHGH